MPPIVPSPPGKTRAGPMPDNWDMADYLIGDVQGCDAALERLLHRIDFSPSRDTLYLLGDLINRGPDSMGVLRRLHALEGSAHCILGNHDLHALSVALGLRRASRMDTLHSLLQDKALASWLDWLRQQDLALYTKGVLMVHAGVLPQWDVTDTLARAAEVQAALRGPQWQRFLAEMYGNEPDQWDDGLQGMPRLRVIVNALTRLRFCSADGRMEFATTEGMDAAPPGLMPWFNVPGRRTVDKVVAFGHWSRLGWLDRPDVLALDSGCVWGGCLTALRLSGDGQHERFQVRCPQAQKPD